MTIEQIMARVSKQSDGCWLWRGALQSQGYGSIRSAWAQEMGDSLVHRLVYRLLVGPIPEGLDLLHSCDTPACCRPEHLRPGTHRDNMREMGQRNPASHGSGRYNAKLNEAAIQTIRRLVGEGTSQRRLAMEYGVHPSLISRVVAGQRWAHT